MTTVACPYCGGPIEIPNGYGAIHARKIHRECEIAKAAEEAAALAAYDAEDFDALWAEFVAEYEANKDEIKKGKEAARARMRAKAEEVQRKRRQYEAELKADAERQLDEPIVPGGTVTRRDLIRYAKETEDFPSYVAKHGGSTLPWWLKLLNRAGIINLVPPTEK